MQMVTLIYGFRVYPLSDRGLPNMGCSSSRIGVDDGHITLDCLYPPRRRDSRYRGIHFPSKSPEKMLGSRIVEPNWGNDRGKAAGPAKRNTIVIFGSGD
jgi:hypothetical protein